MNSLLNFDNVTFQGKLSNMQTVFMQFMHADYKPSKYFEKKYVQGLPARTMDVIYDALRIYKGTYPNIHRFLAKTNKGYITEIKEGSDTFCIMILSKKDGSLYVKAGSIDENDVIQSVSFTPDTKKYFMLALMPLFLTETEAHNLYDTMSDFLEWDVDADDWIYNNHINDFSQLLNVFSTNLEMRLTRQTGEDDINIDIDKISRRELLRLVEVGASCFNHYCANYDVT